jgi:signal recognition particle receptor subunit beta
MAESNPENALVNARIVFWGVNGSGKTANLQAIHAKLRPDHRGEMQEVSTPLDPTVTFEELPIELGEIAGVRTQIRLVAVPGGPEQQHTRKQILDEVNGIVLVVDSQPERLDENIACLAELKNLLAAYGRNLEDIPFVVQYNKRDLADAYFMEDLHRKLAPGDAPVFETVATEMTGVLQTLSTISKRVIRSLREQAAETPSAPAQTAPREAEPPTIIEERPALSEMPGEAPASAPKADLEPEPPTRIEPMPAVDAGAPISSVDPISTAERMEAAILEEADNPDFAEVDSTARQAESLLDTSWAHVTSEIEKSDGVRIGADLSIVSVGEAARSGERSVRVPLVLGDADGNTARIALTIQLDPLMDED